MLSVWPGFKTNGSSDSGRVPSWTKKSARGELYAEPFEGDNPDDEAEQRLNTALWQYSVPVATLTEAELDEFVRQTQAYGQTHFRVIVRIYVPRRETSTVDSAAEITR